MEKSLAKKLESQPSAILLFDSSSNINELKKFLSKQPAKIITFDYESHAELSKEKIEHEISDNYSKIIYKNNIFNIFIIYLKGSERSSINCDVFQSSSCT